MTENCIIKSPDKSRKKRRDLCATARPLRSYPWSNLLCKSGMYSPMQQQDKDWLCYCCLSARSSSCQTAGMNSRKCCKDIVLKARCWAITWLARGQDCQEEKLLFPVVAPCEYEENRVWSLRSLSCKYSPPATTHFGKKKNKMEENPKFRGIFLYTG